MTIRSGRMELVETAVAGFDSIPAAPRSALAFEILSLDLRALGGLLLLSRP